MTQYWLMKSEPEEYGWHDLVRDGEGTWDGVRNAAKRARDQLFPLLGVPKPTVKAPNNAGRKKKRQDDDQQYEYAALVREVGY